MITNIRHTGIVVQDLDKCLTFFVDLLGFKIAKKMNDRGNHLDSMLDLKSVDLITVKIKAPDGNMLELLKFNSHRISGEVSWAGSIYSIGLTHLAFTVDNLDKVYSTLSAKGIIFNSPPQISPDGYAKVTFCRGPENLFLELVEVIG